MAECCNPGHSVSHNSGFNSLRYLQPTNMKAKGSKHPNGFGSCEPASICPHKKEEMICEPASMCPYKVGGGSAKEQLYTGM
jgi:hypothetical protein